MRFGDVVERHHHQRQEEHRRDRANPVPVRCQDAVLIGGGCPPHEFQRSQVRREKAETGYPCRHLTAGHEEIFAGVGLSLQIPADGKYKREVKSDNHHIHRGKVHQPRRSKGCHCLNHLWFLDGTWSMCVRPLSCTYTKTLEKRWLFVNHDLRSVPFCTS